MKTSNTPSKLARNSSSDSDSESSPTAKRRFADAVIEFPITSSNLQTNEKQQSNPQTMLKLDKETSVLITRGQQEFLARKLSDFLDRQIEFESSDINASSTLTNSESEQHRQSIRLFSHLPSSSQSYFSLDSSSSQPTSALAIGAQKRRRNGHKHKDFAALAVSGDQVIAQSNQPHFTKDQKSNVDEKQSLPEENVK